MNVIVVSESRLSGNHERWTGSAAKYPTQPLLVQQMEPLGGSAITAALWGADMTCCGPGNNFNARRGADNFDDESFACVQTKLSALVYVTVNVI